MLPKKRKSAEVQETVCAKEKAACNNNAKATRKGSVKGKRQEISVTVTSAYDDSRGKGSTRRSSARLQSQRRSTFSSNSTPGKPLLVDSAYDGDEESSPSTEGDDPYSVSAMEDVPMVSKDKRKKQGKQRNKTKTKTTTTTKTNVKKQTFNMSGHTSSTPNLAVQPPLRRSTRSSAGLNTTPEVTPILPVKSVDIASPDLSFSTPQIYQLAVKKASSVDSSASPSLQSSSQADSGIAVSPPAKRARIQPGEPRHKSAAVLGKKFMNKRNIFSPNSKQQEGKDLETKEKVDSSCFGFNSLESPDLGCHGKNFAASGVYRCAQPVTSDSSPTSPSRQLFSTDSENWPDASQRQWPSPGLFSDDMLSAESESLGINKSSVKTYKPSKVKKFKHKKSITKFEAWANEKNMEIEDIEKFDLNIE